MAQRGRSGGVVRRAMRRHAASNRRGAVSYGVIAVIASLGVAMTAAIVIGPGMISASNLPTTPAPPTLTPPQQRAMDDVASLLGRSTAVLAMHDRSKSPFTEVVLWLDDQNEPGVLSRGEVALLSHSRILQTITLYILGPKGDASEKVDVQSTALPGFCESWRGDPRVVAVTVASGISDAQFDRSARPQGPGTLRFELTWPAETADVPTTASAEIDAHLIGN